METILVSLGGGLLQAFEPLNLFMIFAGCLAGLFVGCMPGLGSVNGVAILLPVTFLVPPTAAIIFLAALVLRRDVWGGDFIDHAGYSGRIDGGGDGLSTGGPWRSRARPTRR